jgi:hypothetical protein
MPGKRVAKQSARRTVRQVSRATTPMEGVGVVKRVSKVGSSANFIRQATANHRREHGAGAAKSFRKTLRSLDRSTSSSPTNRTAARKAANRQARKMG